MTFPAIDEFAYFDGFQYNDGTDNDYWWNTGSTMLANNHIIYAYQDGKGGNSTVECNPATGTLVLWTITLGNGGNLSYVDGAATGHLGSFVQQGGSPTLNKVIGINGVTYAAQNGNLLASATTASPNSYDDPNCLWTITYDGTTYTLADFRYDYCYRVVSQCANGPTVISSTSDLQYYPEQLEIGFLNGTLAKYIGVDGINYTYRPNSTAANLLTKLNGYALAPAGNSLSLPKTSIQSFVWNGNSYELSMPCWIDYGQGSNPRYYLYYCYSSSTAYGYYGGTQFSNGDLCAAYIKPDGTFGGLSLTGSSTSDGYGEEGASLTGGPVSFLESGVMGDSVISFINNRPYTTIGALSLYGPPAVVVPVPPVATFTYDGKAYQYGRTDAGANNTFITQYTAPGGATATMTWSQITNKFVSMQIKPTATGGVAKYVNGDAVGRPGAYVLYDTPALLNKLTQVNSTGFTPSGDAALPTGGYVDSNGVFDVKGNFMTLGQWSNMPDHVGFSLSYDDGSPVSTPATIEFTAGRTVSTWLWDAATSDGMGVNVSMQLDEKSRLMLYPPTSTAANAPAVPAPTIVLNPNGISRFDKPVRIAPQGDLQMGIFTTEPAQ